MTHTVATSLPCQRPGASESTRLQSLAEGWIPFDDLCDARTTGAMAALDSASPEPLSWYPAYGERVARRS